MEPFLGQLMAVGFNFPPRGWALCDGQLLSIAANSALFSLLGTAFGGDGRTTFALPDLRSRSIVHVGTGAGLSPISWGERGGAETVTLTVNNLPPHNHQGYINAKIGLGDETNPNGANGLASATEDLYFDGAATHQTALGSVQTSNAGGGQSVQIRNPFLGIYVCIALQGIFPSRS